MNLFLIDTSGKNGLLSIVRRDDQGTRELAAESLNGGQYSAELIPKFAAMLERLSLKKTDIDAIAVVAGPGSFTGLRVGLAAAKGLAEILRKPLIAFSALEIVAAGAPSGLTEVVAALDAGRGDLFLGHCEVHPKLEVRTLTEWLIKPAELAERMKELKATLVTADERISTLAMQSNLPVETIDAPGIELMALLAFVQLDRGDVIRPDDLDANYIRRSDAELFTVPQR